MPIALWFWRWFTPRWATASPTLKVGLGTLIFLAGTGYAFFGPLIFDAAYWVMGKIAKTATNRRLRGGISVGFAAVYLIAVSASGSAAKKADPAASPAALVAVGSTAPASAGASVVASAVSTPTAAPTATPIPTPTAVLTPTPVPTATLKPTPTPAPTPKPTPSPTPAPTFRTFEAGTLVVGTDIVPGTYRAADAAFGCYWERLKGFDGTLDDVIENDLAMGPAIVTILKTDKGFTSRGCGSWTSDLSAILAPSDPIEDGTYIVGVDLPAGTYKAAPSGGTCYWERLKGFTGGLGDIIANDLSTSSVVVTIRSTDKGFKSHGCGTWTKK